MGDDEWVVIAVTNDAEWIALCRVIGQPALADDPQFATVPERLRHQALLDPTITAWTRRRSKHDAAALLQAGGVPAAPVQKACDVVESEYLQERAYFTPLEHAEAGVHPYPGSPFHFSETKAGLRRAAPCFGQHTYEILRDVLSLSAAEIEELECHGTIRGTLD